MRDQPSMPASVWIELLEAQRSIYAIPPGRARFDRYLEVMLNEARDAVRRPLVMFNPMGKPAAAERLDAWIELGAEQIGRECLTVALDQLPLEAEAFPFRVGLVLVDDRAGGWTNRAAVEFQIVKQTLETTRHGFVVVPLWTSEEPTIKGLEQSIRRTLFRAWTAQRRGDPRDLAEILSREGDALRFAGRRPGPHDHEELEYTRAVLDPLRGADDFGTILAALFGDTAARSLGLQPLGLSTGAGLELALFEACEDIARCSGGAREAATPS